MSVSSLRISPLDSELLQTELYSACLATNLLLLCVLFASAWAPLHKL